MGRYLKQLKIPGTSAPTSFLVPSTYGTVHVICGENSVGKSFVLSKLESLWRGVKENGFELITEEKEDSLDGTLSLYYGKIWKQKDRCGSFHFSNTKKKEVAPSDGPIDMYSSTLKFIYECAFRGSAISIDVFSNVSKYQERMDFIESQNIQFDASACFPCPIEHPLVKQIESIFEGYHLYYQFFHEKHDEKCFEFVMVSPDGYVSTQSKWSDGQKTVFYLLLNLYYQHSSFVILDEVENHMHPFYITKVLDIIKKSGRQCVLSTHHPHVIFSEYVDRVFYMELEKNGSFPMEREIIENRQTNRIFHRKITELITDFEKITNTYKLFDNRDIQLLKLSKYYCNEVELKAYEIIARIRTSNMPVSSTISLLPDKQSQLLSEQISKPTRILDIGAGYGRIKDELDKVIESKAEWFLYNHDISQHAVTAERFVNDNRVHAICNYDEIEDGTINAAILANVIHEITPPAFREIILTVEKKLSPSGRLYIIDMEPLLYAEHYAVPYTYTEIEDLLTENGWACNHDIIPHKFVTLYIVSAEKLGTSGNYDIESLWEKKKAKALGTYLTSRVDSTGDYQKMMQAMTTVCSIESFHVGIWK